MTATHGTQHVHAPRRLVYRALLDAGAVQSWMVLSSMRIPYLLSAAAGLAACSNDVLGANGIPSRTLSLTLGQTLELTLQTIGPGEYASPPTVSSTSVRFVDVTLVTPAVPAGVTQRFRFRAETPGRAIIMFQHSGQASDPGTGLTVHDTVEVHQ